MVDEIQTGVGRTGTFLASQKTQVAADILCLGKGLAGGIPVGATVVTERVAASIPKHIHTSTFGGNPLACAGVLATLALLTEQQLAQVQALGETLRTSLRALTSPLIETVRGEGLMIGVVMKDKRNQILKLLQDRRVLAIPAGDDVVRLLPSFVITEADITQAVHAFQASLDTLA